MPSPWIGVDLDGTLAHYDGWKGEDHIGEPIVEMVGIVKQWLAQGYLVKIFTARANNSPAQIELVKQWCIKHIGQELEITATKDFAMISLWDDRCVQVETNTGKPILGLLNDIIERFSK